MRRIPFTGTALLTAALLASSATASTLQLNGGSALTVDTGAPFNVSILGGPGQSTLLLFDVLPGPTPLYGQSVAVGFSPFLGLLSLGALPPSGVLSFPAVVPELPQVDQITIYLVAAVGDPAHPAQIQFSNGAALTLQDPPDAGEPRAVIAGHAVAIGSHGLADPNGSLQPGVSVTWVLTQSPAGSGASLAFPTSAFPTLVPDQPGDYVVQASMSKYGKGYLDQAVVHACRVTFNGIASGDIVPGDTTVSGSIQGPVGLTLEVDGQPAALSAGAFGPIGVTFQNGAKTCTKVFAIHHPDGSEVVTTPSFVRGTAAPISGGANSSMTTMLTASGVAKLAELVETVAEGVDIEPALKALPPVVLVDQPGPFGGTLFSASADILAVNYNPALALSQAPKSTGLDTTLVLNSVSVTVKISGLIANVSYSVTGTASANPATFKAIVKLTPSGSSLGATVTSPSMSLSNFALSLPGFPGVSSQLSLITSALSPYLASAMQTQVATVIKNAITSIYATLANAYSVQPKPGVQMNLSSKFAKVVHTATSLAFDLDVASAVPSPAPGTPAVTKYVANPSAVPAIPGVGPGGPFDIASGIADDFFNESLASGIVGGLLERQAEALSLTIGDLKDRIPALDLGDLAPTLPVVADIHATGAPFLEPTPNGPGMARIRFAGVEMGLAAVLGSHTVPLVRLALEGTIDVDVAIAGDGTLAVSVVQAGASAVVIESAFHTAVGFAQSAVDPLLESTVAEKLAQVMSAFLDGIQLVNDAISAAMAFLASSAMGVGDWLVSFFSGS